MRRATTTVSRGSLSFGMGPSRLRRARGRAGAWSGTEGTESVRERGSLAHDLRLLRRLRCLVHHGVGVLDARSVGTAVLLQQAHEGVVVLLVGPVALPLEQRRDRGQPGGAGL